MSFKPKMIQSTWITASNGLVTIIESTNCSRFIEIYLYHGKEVKFLNLNQRRKLFKAYDLALKTGNPPLLSPHIVKNLNLNNKNVKAFYGDNDSKFPDFVITGKNCGL